MPVRSEAQRRYLYSKFGSAWVHKHGFDNTGKLPGHVKKHPHRSAVLANLRKGR